MTLQNSVERFPSIKKMGVTVDCGDFLIIRPAKSYRMHSSVVIIKGKEPIIIDAGTTIEPGIKLIQQSLATHNIDPLAVKFIILTHSHSDHVLQLYGLQRLCSNAKVICHQRDAVNIQHPTRMERSWQRALKLLGKSDMNLLLYRIFTAPGYILFYRSINLYPRVDYLVTAPVNQNGFTLENCPKISSGNQTLRFIPTPGHTAGHMCVYHQEHKLLFLGDFVPFTPWINPLPEALDGMIQSIKNILTLTDDEVEYTVSAHGDIHKDNWEIMEWDCAKEKFQEFLDTIYESLDKIPKLVLRRPLTSENIAQLLIPKYKRYSWIMRVFFIPPALTWILAYCQKLELEGKIRRIHDGKKIIWTAIED
ncbi:MAG: MBL fold metallo-hydrolase [Promethearchaeota archaeon]